MIAFVLVLIFWTAAAAAAVAVLWRRLRSHHKVYGLILLHGLYVGGVFLLYGWVRHLP